MEAIQGLLGSLPHWLTLIMELLGALVLVFTVVGRMIPKSVFGEHVSKVAKVIFKVIQWMPTIGINPQTKKIEEAYDDLKKGKVQI